jgi:hypothetical protein
LTSGSSMPIGALNPRIGVMGHPMMVPLGLPSRSPGPFPPLTSMASQFRSPDIPAGLTAKQATTFQPIRNSDSDRKGTTRVPCRARGMSPGHDVQVRNEREQILDSTTLPVIRHETPDSSIQNVLHNCSLV